MSRIVCMDFETTGMNLYTDHVFNIGADDGEVTLDLYVNACGTEDVVIPPEVQELTGMSTAELKAHPLAAGRKEQFTKLLEFLASGKETTLVFHNGKAFDTYFLIRELDAEGLALPSNVTHLADSYLWARYDLKRAHSGLDGLAEELGVENPRVQGRHLARVDSTLLHRVLKTLMEAHGPISSKRVETTHECLARVSSKLLQNGTPMHHPPPTLPEEEDAIRTAVDAQEVRIAALEKKVDDLMMLIHGPQVTS